MTLIADAGSTKTEWFINGRTFFSQGINPILMSEESVLAEFMKVKDETERPSHIRFYGAGCTPEKSVIVARLLRESFPAADGQVNSDLRAAAHALCGREKGVACILGTGSNSCLYDGERIVQNTPALGYILGDEGSGAVLGRLFLNALLKKRVGESVAEAFSEEYRLTQADIIERVYRQPMANRWLASLSVFIARHRDDESVRSIIAHNFASFLDNNVHPYHFPHLSFTGSIAYHYADILREVAAAKGYTVRAIVKSPMPGLADYYRQCY